MTSAQQQLIVEYLPLVRAIARQVQRRYYGLELDELVQDGSMGLIEAVLRFDPERGAFEPYARRRIAGAIVDALRQRIPGWRPRGIGAERCADCPFLLAESRRCHAQAEQTPAGCPRRRIRLEPLSVLVQLPAAPSAETQDAWFGGTLRRLLQGLSPREKSIIVEHYFLDRSFQEIADGLDISVSMAYQMHARILRRFRRALERTVRAAA